MKVIRAYFQNGHQLETTINGSDEAITDYYIGHEFNIGNADEDV